MKLKLLAQTVFKFIFGIVFFGALIFLPAGTLEFLNAWLFMGLLFIPMFILGIVLFIKNPELLEKRVKGKEKENTQKVVVFLTLIMFIAGFVVAGLDFRYGWTSMPNWAIIIGLIILVVSYAVYAEVMRENTYLSRNIEVQENQKVIDTGLYGVVRHPMYMATTFLFMSFPIVLGSLVSFIIFLPLPILLAKRIKNEEEVLEKGLEGYKEYKQKVKYKMIPFIW